MAWPGGSNTARPRPAAGHPCFHCRLPVRFDVADTHPGRAVVDHEPGAPADQPNLPDLQVCHRLCHHTPARDGLITQRALLGWATERHESGAPVKRYAARQCRRLGLHPAALPGPAHYRRYWQVRKMRYATIAARRYIG